MPEPEDLPATRDPERYRPNRAQWTLAGLVVLFVVAVVLLKILKGAGLEQTSAFYIGIPAVLALLLTLSSPSTSVIGLSLKTMTVFLLLSMPVLGEGFVCVIFAAPIFYLVALLVAVVVQAIRGQETRRRGLPIVVLPVVLFTLSLEGVTPALTFDGSSAVSASRTVDADGADVVAALQRPLDFAGTPLSGVLGWGFPEPQTDHGSGLSIGDRRSIQFDGAHHRSFPSRQHHWGESTSALDLVVTDRTDSSVHLAAVRDTTPISSWLTWNGADVRWRGLPDGGTEITWTLTYTRELAPAFYFAPVEKFVAERAARYLVDALDVTCATC